ncbi:unnamed protein product, partial [Ectocarpus sp. 4 AP-2014]
GAHGHDVQRAVHELPRCLRREPGYPAAQQQDPHHHALCSDGRVPPVGQQARPRRQVLLPQRHRQPAQVPQPAHALLQLRAALPVRGGPVGDGPGADHPHPTREAHRAPPPPVGAPDHLHRAHQEPPLQLLEPQLHALRARARARVRERGAQLHDPGGCGSG